jgi:hypothetical protein
MMRMALSATPRSAWLTPGGERAQAVEDERAGAAQDEQARAVAVRTKMDRSFVPTLGAREQ